nr:ABC transporter substrate-binding protein [uncultured Cellulosilyticum sp.]
MRRKIGKLLAVASLASALVGCSSTNESVVNISIYNTKREIHTNLEAASKAFSEANPDIKVKVLGYSRYQEVKDKIASRRNYDNTPTIMIVDSLHIQDLKEEFVDLSDETWAEYLSIDMGEAARNSEGGLVAFPFAVEGMGLIYNQKVMEECGIDVDKIRTRNALEEAFKKVEDSGRKAVIITNDDWSLANHFFTTAYSVKSEDSKAKVDFIADLKAGKVDLAKDETINGLLDTFDLMKSYNMYKEAPLSNSNERCAEALGRGEVGFWYMGNWAMQDILRSDVNKGDYGLIPVPISNDATDYGNNEITAAVKYLVIDKGANSVEQQEAAKRFIDWLVYEEKGNDFMVNEAGLIPGVVANNIEFTNSLSNSIKTYQENNQVIEQMMAYLPHENVTQVGNLLRAYLDNKIDRNTFLNELKNFWMKYN